MDAAEPFRQPAGGRATRFFLWAAGTDRSALASLPRSETIKQVGFGTLVVVPAVLALFAMTYAISTLTDSLPLCLAAGVVWSAIVFCFDRFIVSTFRKSGSTWQDVTSAVFLSRLVFAVFVGVIVAHPLVMLYFSDTIEERLALEGRRQLAALADETAARRQPLGERVAALKSEIRERERERNDHQQRLVDEIDGIVSGRTTGIPGRGASAAEKKLQLQVAQLELDAARQRNLAEIAAIEGEIGRLAGELESRQAGFRQSTDYLARARALSALSAEEPHVNRVKWFLLLFFVFVDTLPIVFKGFTPRGPYDERLRLAEFQARREVRARRDSLQRVLYPHMVLAQESRFMADESHAGVRDFARRYRDFLDELSRHQREFLAEWQRQQEVLAAIEDERLRRGQLDYMEQLRSASVEVVERAVERFRRSLAWQGGGAGAEG